MRLWVDIKRDSTGAASWLLILIWYYSWFNLTIDGRAGLRQKTIFLVNFKIILTLRQERFANLDLCSASVFVRGFLFVINIFYVRTIQLSKIAICWTFFFSLHFLPFVLTFKFLFRKPDFILSFSKSHLMLSLNETSFVLSLLLL